MEEIEEKTHFIYDVLQYGVIQSITVIIPFDV